LADYLGCSVSRVKDLRQRGLPGRQIGKRVLFDRIEVDRFLEQS
jgi:excisionase family DNA binding protein